MIGQMQKLTNFRENKETFLGTLTHEIRTPLTNINLFLDLLEVHPTILKDQPELIEAMRSNQRALLNTVNNILDLEKPNANGTMRAKKDAFNLVHSIELVAKAMKLPALAKQISLHCQIDTHSLFIYGDHQQIERVLLNLISNAIKYTQRMGSVTVGAFSEKHHGVITVQDNGYGIPSEELPYIFDRFYRVNKHKNKANGTGLGLDIAKSIVEAHGGDISVASRENLGSVFTVRLPAER